MAGCPVFQDQTESLRELFKAAALLKKTLHGQLKGLRNLPLNRIRRKEYEGN